MATKAKIKTDAAENLGILSEGTQLTAYMSADFEQAYQEVYAVLEELDLSAWTVDATIPDAYANAVATLVAEARAVKYQIPDARYQRIKLEASQAMHTIRQLQARSAMGQTVIENF